MDSNNLKIAQHAHLVTSGKLRKLPGPGTAQLTYFIFEGVLTGFIDSEFVHTNAYSGGAGGSIDRPATRKMPARKAALQTTDANNPYSTGVIENGAVRGGPLPEGSYSIAIPEKDAKLGLCARLSYGSVFKVRTGGFAIHGQGPKGSDGCIVIPDANFHDIMDGLTKSKGGHLQVLQAMESVFA